MEKQKKVNDQAAIVEPVKVVDPVKVVWRAGQRREYEDGAMLYELWSRWLGLDVEIVCRTGERCKGVLRAVSQYNLVVEMTGEEVVFFKTGLVSVRALHQGD